MTRLARPLVLLPLLLLALPAPGPAAVKQRQVQHAGQARGSEAFVAIVKRGERFRAYVSDATHERATLAVWFRGVIAADGSLSDDYHGVALAARIADDRASGTVTLPDGRVLGFAMRERRGGLVERNFVHEGLRYRSGWIVLEDGRVRGRTMRTGASLDGTPDPAELAQDCGVLRAQRGRLLHQSGVREGRLNRGGGSPAAYDRLNHAIGALDETIWELERPGGPYAACDSP